jgi:integrase
MREPKLKHFLKHLANNRKVSASTQNQALCAILYLYRKALETPLELIKGVDRTRRRKNLPVVLSRREVRTILLNLDDVYWLLASLLYGTGMCITEALHLRINDIDFDYSQITVRKGKGGCGVRSPLDTG